MSQNKTKNLSSFKGAYPIGTTEVETMNTEIIPAKRYATQEQAYVEICGRDTKLYCSVENISITGAALQVISTHSIPKPNDVVTLSIHLQSIKKHHNLYGEVIWVRGLKLGVKFIDQVLAHRKILSKNSM